MLIMKKKTRKWIDICNICTKYVSMNITKIGITLKMFSENNKYRNQ